jgi:excisionase family DNA binding protein
VDVHVDEYPPSPTEGRPQTPEQLLFTIPKAAEALRISRTKLYELLDANAIESVHLGRARRIPAEALHAYVAKPRHAETGAPS